MGQRWFLNSGEQIRAFLAKVNEMRSAGEPITVEFSTTPDPKSNQQVRYIYSLITALANAKRARLEDVKKDTKVAFGVITVSTSIVDGSRTARLKSFEEYTKEEATAFISALEVYLSENDIPYIPSRL